jgi:hypothetical protein
MAGFDRYAKPTWRELFLTQMDKVVPWGELCAVIAPVYPKVEGGLGRPPVGLERRLRIYFLQQWFNLRPGRERGALRLAGHAPLRGYRLGTRAEAR